MPLFGSQFSSAFAEVVLMTDAVVIGVVLVAVFFDSLASGCAKALHHASSLLTSAMMHAGLRRK